MRKEKRCKGHRRSQRERGERSPDALVYDVVAVCDLHNRKGAEQRKKHKSSSHTYSQQPQK